jgi:hypothetical protein
MLWAVFAPRRVLFANCIGGLQGGAHACNLTKTRQIVTPEPISNGFRSAGAKIGIDGLKQYVPERVHQGT